MVIVPQVPLLRILLPETVSLEDLGSVTRGEVSKLTILLFDIIIVKPTTQCDSVQLLDICVLG